MQGHRAGQREGFNSSQTDTQTNTLVTVVSLLLHQPYGHDLLEKGIEETAAELEIRL